MPLRTVVMCLSLLSSTLAAGQAATPLEFADDPTKKEDRLEVELALSMDFETPHTKWAKPYALGPTRVVFVAPWFQGSTDGREMVELMQRFDLDARAVHHLGGTRLHGDGNPSWYEDSEAGTKRFLRLLDEKPDVLFLNQLGLNAFSPAVLDAVRKAVSGGVGLVMVNASDILPFLEAQALENGPQGMANGKFATLGKGRIAILPRREKLEFTLGWETTFDYQMEQQGRALLWAANREPRVGLAVHVPAEPVARDAGTHVSLSWNPADPGMKVRVALTRWDGHRQSLLTVDGAAGRAEAPLPPGREGVYHLDAFALRGDAIVDWATAALNLSADVRIEELSLERDWAEIGESLPAVARVSRPFQPGECLKANLVDRYGRILKTLTPSLDASGIGTSFAFEVEPWMPMLVRVEALLCRGDEEVASSSAYARITQRRRGEFHFMMWNTPTGDLAPYGNDSLARHGVTSILQGGPPPLSFSQSGLAYVPYAQSFRASAHTLTSMLNPETGVLKSGCIHDEATMQEQVRKTLEAQTKARQHGVFVYSLGDENAVRASCLSPHCLKAYRAYLQEIYGDIDALNREWTSRYGSFDEIELLAEGDLPSVDAPAWFRKYFAQRQQLHRTDNEGVDERQVVMGNLNDEMRALQAGNFARWYDRQAFQSWSYVQWCKRFVKAFRELDPQSLTGFEGTDSFSIRRQTTRTRQGGDLDLIVREMEYFGPYKGPANEVVRSLAPQGFPMGNWIGYSREADNLLHDYWAQVTNGMNTVQWWRWDNLDGYRGFLTPTFSVFPATRELLEDTQIVRDGLGSLLMHCAMYDDGVAMLYSMPSTHIAHFDGNPTYGDYTRDHGVWHEWLHGLGLQFRYVTDRMLRQDEFDPDKYKVLILPLAFAVGEKEAQVIRTFVEGGGTVIADVRPGLYDGHCKPLEKGMLDDVFGIAREPKDDALDMDGVYIDGAIGGHAISARWRLLDGQYACPMLKADPTVRVTTGKALGKAYPLHYWDGINHPVCIVNDYGKGRAILLNMAPYGGRVEGLLKGILEASGVKPVIRVEKANGDDAPEIEVTRWSNGDLGLLALFGDYDGTVRVTLPAESFAYDLKARSKLGSVRTFTTVVKRHRAAFFAMSPKDIAAPLLALSNVEPASGEVVEATVRVPDARGHHAVRIAATPPDGTPAPWFDTVMIVDDGTAGFPVPLALNEKRGRWTLTATDLFTDEKAQATFTVR